MTSTSGNGVTPSRRTFNESLHSSSTPFTAAESSIARAAYAALLADTRVSLADLARRVNLPVGTVECVGGPAGRRPLHGRRTARRLPRPVPPTDGARVRRARPHAVRVVRMGRPLSSACDRPGGPPNVTLPGHRSSDHPFGGPDGVLDVDPASAVMSFVASSGPAGDGAGAGCPYIPFLESPAAGKQWQAGHPTGCVLTVDQAWSLAR